MELWIAISLSVLQLSTAQGLELSLGGGPLQNNSLVDIDTINVTRPLVCGALTSPCCEDGVWRLPNGTAVGDGFGVVSNNSLQLFPLNGTEPPSGLYSCHLNNQTVYTGLYHTMGAVNNGRLMIVNLTYDPHTRTLTCISRGGPVTYALFQGPGSFDNQSVNQTVVSVIVDSDTAEYEHSLSLQGRTEDSGVYQCSVENNLSRDERMLELQSPLAVCSDGSLRIQGDISDAVVQLCMANEWHEIVLVHPLPSEIGTPFPVDVEATDTSLTVHWLWNDMDNIYEVACDSDQGSVRIISQKKQTQVVAAQPATMYNCCVSILSNTSRVYTTHARSCRSISTPMTNLSTLEIALMAVGGALLLLLGVQTVWCILCCCCIRRRTSKYEKKLSEQSKQYTKQRIRLMTRPPSEVISNSNIMFNRSASELEQSHTFTPAHHSQSTKAHTVTQLTEVPTNSPIKAQPHPSILSKPPTAPKPSNPTLHKVSDEDQPIYTEPVSPAHCQGSPSEEASNPMYGGVSHDDEAENPMYGTTRH